MKQTKEWLILVGGFLGALKLFLASFGITFLTDDMISSFLGLLENGVPLILLLYAVYKNTYVIKTKSRKQKELLDDYDEVINDQLVKEKLIKKVNK